jgi:hypothetical protein
MYAYEITLLSVCARVCVSPPIVARQGLGERVPVATNTHETIE